MDSIGAGGFMEENNIFTKRLVKRRSDGAFPFFYGG
jgi:hypothetical protein